MNILVNNTSTQTNAHNVAELVAEQQLPERGVAIAINNKVVPRADWKEKAIAEGDNVTIIKAAFGG